MIVVVVLVLRRSFKASDKSFDLVPIKNDNIS